MGKGEGEKRAGEKREKGRGHAPCDGGAAEEGEGKKKQQGGGGREGDACKSKDVCLGLRDSRLFVVSGSYHGVYCEVCLRVLREAVEDAGGEIQVWKLESRSHEKGASPCPRNPWSKKERAEHLACLPRDGVIEHRSIVAPRIPPRERVRSQSSPSSPAPGALGPDDEGADWDELAAEQGKSNAAQEEEIAAKQKEAEEAKEKEAEEAPETQEGAGSANNRDRGAAPSWSIYPQSWEAFRGDPNAKGLFECCVCGVKKIRESLAGPRVGQGQRWRGAPARGCAGAVVSWVEEWVCEGKKANRRK